ncbi:MAG TPA: hypothetical protein VL689_21710 [Paraburkholderia sp.]|jgi:hypothetical protein|nr:hypothetical protein [Paraburkholderia sp.]
MAEFSLLNSMDDCLAPYIGVATFEESLLLNILFQDQMLLHENSMFDSRILAAHFAKPGQKVSLFEEAARRGLITPALRDPACETLREAHARTASRYPPEYELVIPQMKPYEERAIDAIDSAIRNGTKPLHWPRPSERGLLESEYRNVVASVLQSQDPPSYVNSNRKRRKFFAATWSDSAVWRFDCVEEALKRSHDRGIDGLQRSELLNAIGRREGISISNGKIGVDEILLKLRSGDPRRARSAESFLKWVTQCHHVAQSQYFGATNSFPVYSIEHDFILQSILRSPTDTAPPPTEGFRCKVRLPPMDLLLKSDASDLLSIREDIGREYLFRLESWQKQPSIQTQEAVEVALKTYCEAICVRYKHATVPVVAVISTLSAIPWTVLPNISDAWTTIQNGKEISDLVADPSLMHFSFASIAKLVASGVAVIRGGRANSDSRISGLAEA